VRQACHVQDRGTDAGLEHGFSSCIRASILQAAEGSSDGGPDRHRSGSHAQDQGTDAGPEHCFSSCIRASILQAVPRADTKRAAGRNPRDADADR
jgi:hypothetical protein